MDIGIVLVTFNRLKDLKKALACYDKQSYSPSYVLVVDNCSTDGTYEYLEDWLRHENDHFQKIVKHLDSNKGGAGGFYAGMNKSLGLRADWIWLADDDAFPREDALERLNSFYEKQSSANKSSIAALCTANYNQGKPHLDHRSTLKLTSFRYHFVKSTRDDYERECFRVDVFSYVGVVIKKKVLQQVGLDDAGFFIYCDDQDHSLRVRKAGNIYCVPKSIVDHDKPPYAPNTVNWGKYYRRRNELLMLKRNFPKRYFYIRFIRGYIGECSFISRLPKELKIMLRAAYKDAWKGKEGIHSVYKPGWKITKTVKRGN
ncbi:glycosyltransferase [Ligilactobacillus acidipiscis]|uniref:glycosyltransferase n=1 Tax=Ligilactobacillus acidipiscis TaxID=89059 RepID=UPI0023F90800|nr:glycosyltransferase [Ligilactobacillus acidipiscis]WEV56574.1 glycosyltransferase [Ligilactobacillus acidipiscis]